MNYGNRNDIPVSPQDPQDLQHSRVSRCRYAPDGGMSQLIVPNEDTGEQITAWTYGTTLAESAIARSDLPVAKTYPGGQIEHMAYNRQGEVSTYTDPNASVHAYRRDKLGRLTDDGVTMLASGIDGLVRRISTTYDNRGRVECLTSADNPAPGSGTVVNQVKLGYNGIDCLVADSQSHSGAVTGGTPKVEYQCSAAEGNILRRTAMTYPNGRSLAFEYGAVGSIDDAINRVRSRYAYQSRAHRLSAASTTRSTGCSRCTRT